MSAGNIDAFKVQVYRAFLHLYQNHPRPMTLDNAALSGIEEHKDGSVSVPVDDANDADEGAERGTILWLHRNGYVTGDLQENLSLNGPPSAFIGGAQLSSRALRLLMETDQNLGGPLGQRLVDLKGSRQEKVAIDRLADVILR